MGNLTAYGEIVDSWKTSGYKWGIFRVRCPEWISLELRVYYHRAIDTIAEDEGWEAPFGVVVMRRVSLKKKWYQFWTKPFDDEYAKAIRSLRGRAAELMDLHSQLDAMGDEDATV